MQIKFIVRLEEFATFMTHKGLAILAGRLALSPLSVVGPMLEADISVITYLGPISNL